jgi:hypothetical protein
LPAVALAGAAANLPALRRRSCRMRRRGLVGVRVPAPSAGGQGWISATLVECRRRHRIDAPTKLKLRNFARHLDGQHLLRQHHDHRLQVMATLRMYAPGRRKKGMLTLVAALEGVLECPGPLKVPQGVDGRRTGAKEKC